jgi:hypothetical protein
MASQHIYLTAADMQKQKSFASALITDEPN